MKKKPIRVLLLPDSPLWAFDNICNAIIKYNPYPDKIVYSKEFILHRPQVCYNDWDFVYIMFEGEKTVFNNKEKTVRGCYAQIWLESSLYSPEIIGTRFTESRAVIFVNDIIEEIVIPFCEDIEHTVIEDSSDDEIFYPIPDKKQERFTAIFVGNPVRPIKNFPAIEEICKKADVDLLVAHKVPHNELVQCYNKSDICINYSTSEGGPQTFVEAALCGVPMLIRSSNALSQKIPCFTGMTKKGFIEHLLFLKENRGVCSARGFSARDYVLQHNTYKQTAKKFADFFLKLNK